MTGWLGFCGDHIDQHVRIAKRHKTYFLHGSAMDVKLRCDYPGCTKRGKWELYLKDPSEPDVKRAIKRAVKRHRGDELL